MTSRSNQTDMTPGDRTRRAAPWVRAPIPFDLLALRLIGGRRT